MKIIPRYRVLFRHSHGGCGCGSAHKPFLASRASFSSPSTRRVLPIPPAPTVFDQFLNDVSAIP